MKVTVLLIYFSQPSIQLFHSLHPGHFWDKVHKERALLDPLHQIKLLYNEQYGFDLRDYNGDENEITSNFVGYFLSNDCVYVMSV